MLDYVDAEFEFVSGAVDDWSVLVLLLEEQADEEGADDGIHVYRRVSDGERDQCGLIVVPGMPEMSF